MADEAALALQPGGSPSAVAAEREAASPPAGEPLRKRPRRDGPGLGRSPGEPDGAAPEREVLAAAGGGPALWREAAAATAGGEREAQAAAPGGGDNGPGLQGLSLEPPPADDFDDDDDEGEEEDEAAAIGYRGAQGAGGWDCAFPPPSPGAPPGVGWRGLGWARAQGWFCRDPLLTAALSCAPPGLPAWLQERPADSLLPSRPSLTPRPALAASRFAQPPGGEALAGFKISFFPLLLF